VGADYFYLGLPFLGLAKLGTLGGLGAWWLLDIVRIGSGPVYAEKYRVADDLPHWVFVLGTTNIFMLGGFLISLYSYLRIRRQQHRECTLSNTKAVTLLRSYDEAYGPRLQATGQPRIQYGSLDP
jgi:hypothetical protein